MADRSHSKTGGKTTGNQKTQNKKNLSAEDGKGSSGGGGKKATNALAKASPKTLGVLVLSHIRNGRHRDIPFLLPMLMKKTQVVELTMSTDYISISVTNATNYSVVQAVILSGFIDSSNLIALFDEYRPIRGKAYYIPRYIYGGNSSSAAILFTGGAAIDFANNSAWSSSQSLLLHDNHVLFDLLRTSSHPTSRGRYSNATACWDILPDATPDENWVDTSASSSFAFWKPWFNSTDISGSLTAGYLVFEMTFQFRGLK